MESTPFEYTHRINRRARHLKLTIEPNGTLVVVSPKKISEKTILTFIQGNAEWVSKNLKKARATKDHNETLTTLRIFGKQYQKKLSYNTAVAPGVTVKTSHLEINPYSPEQSLQSAAVKRQLDRFLRSTAQSYIIPRTEKLAEKMNVSYKALSLRQQKTRWGSCTSQGNLQFNWRLIHHPAAVIDYVIIHELAHRTEMNHSASFWKIVARHDPSYKRHRAWLKKRGLPVG